MSQLALDGVQGQIDPDNSDSCFTPKWIIEEVAEVMGSIDTDPFWHPDSHVVAPTVYDGRDLGDGKLSPWFGNVWFQPPYSDPLECAKRLRDHVNGGGSFMGLVRHDPTTEWWRTIVNGIKGGVTIGMPDRRVRFDGGYSKGGIPNLIVTFLAKGFSVNRLRDKMPWVDWRAP